MLTRMRNLCLSFGLGCIQPNCGPSLYSSPVGSYVGMYPSLPETQGRYGQIGSSMEQHSFHHACFLLSCFMMVFSLILSITLITLQHIQHICDISSSVSTFKKKCHTDFSRIKSELYLYKDTPFLFPICMLFSNPVLDSIRPWHRSSGL